jgi:DNA polymerase-3 subunit alpha
VLALTNSHYLKKEDAPDQRVLLCAHLKTTFRDVEKSLERDRDGLSRFFRSNRYYLPGEQEMRALHPESELAATLDVANACEPPRIGGVKHLPVFPCPEGKPPDDFLREQCREGWRKKIEPMLKALPATLKEEKKREYGERVKMELEVICKFGFSSYFLIVQDYIRYVRESLRMKVGPGRGSSSGSLCAFLLDITRVEPIRYDLLFERFMNAGRVDAAPDIDTDFEVGAREPLIAYLRQKYGQDNVCPIGTFSRLQGRSILKDVLKAHNRGSYEELNRITAPIPDESAISDDLQVMREEEDEAGIILWALENRADALREWVRKTPDGELEGPLSADFLQAIRLEGGARGMGKHASGYIISPVPVSDVVPLAYDKGGDGLMTGFGMKDVEGAGLLKVDILGLAVLDRLSLFQKIVRTGHV